MGSLRLRSGHVAASQRTRIISMTRWGLAMWSCGIQPIWPLPGHIVCNCVAITHIPDILNIMYLSPSLRPCWGLTWGLCGQPIILKDLTVHRFTARISGGHRSNALMAHTDRRLPSLLPFPILSKKMFPNIHFPRNVSKHPFSQPIEGFFYHSSIM